MTNEGESLRLYLVNYAAEHDWDELWPRVAEGRAQLVAELVGVSDEQGAWRPPSGEGEAAWGIAEVARHVLTYTANVADIVRATAAGKTVTKDPPGAMRQEGGESLAVLRRELVAASSAFLSIPQELPEPGNLDATVAHARFGHLNCRSWFLFPRIHDSDHTEHIKALKQMEGFPA